MQHYKTRIREIRRAKEITLQELADSVGTTPQTIQRLETDKVGVHVDWLLKISKVFNVGVRELLPDK